MFDWLQKLADWITYTILKLPNESFKHTADMTTKGRIGSAVDFFIFDSIKIFILLLVIIYIITFIRSFFTPEKTRKLLVAKKGNTFIGHILAALLGIVTPFCSCSAVPLFIGFVEAGVPLGVTFSYLIAAPMVNEVALGLLYGMFGIKIALMYIASGEIIAIVSGIIIGRLKLEKYVEDYVYEMKVGDAGIDMPIPTIKERLNDALNFTLDLIRKIWLYVLIGIAIGGVMHGWIPAGALAKYAGKDNPLAVFVATIIGVPLYSNAAGIIPLIGELRKAGVALGTALSFMMAVTALSLPEMILLRRVLKPKLLAIFIGIVTCGILFTGYMFNFIFT